MNRKLIKNFGIILLLSSLTSCTKKLEHKNPVDPDYEGPRGNITGTATLQNKGENQHGGINIRDITTLPIGGVVGETTTADSGHYEFINVPVGRYNIEAKKSDYEDFTQENVIVEPDKTTEVSQITLQPVGGTAMIEGHVTSSGVALAGAAITLVYPNGQTQNTTTDSNGYYEFAANVFQGVYTVRAKAKFYQAQEHSNISVNPPNNTTVDISLDQNSPIWTDDFESGSYTVGYPPPSPWTSLTNGSGTLYVDSSAGRDSPKGLHLITSVTSDSAEAIRGAPPEATTDMRLIFDFKRNSSEGDKQHVEVKGSGGTSILAFAWGGSNFAWETGFGGFSILPMGVTSYNWYKVQIDITSDRKINIWIDGSNKILTDGTISFVPNIQEIRFLVSDMTRITHIDNVQVIAP